MSEENSILDSVKKLLLDVDDETFEILKPAISQLISLTESELKGLLNSELLVKDEEGTKVPQDLNYIVIQVVLKRFVRIGKEGLQGYSQSGQTYTFPTNKSDFDEYQSVIDRLNTNAQTAGKMLYFL